MRWDIWKKIASFEYTVILHFVDFSKLLNFFLVNKMLILSFCKTKVFKKLELFI